MNNLSQFILKKREEFDELFPTQETHASNGYPNGYADGRNETILEIQSHLLQSHIELLEEMRRVVEKIDDNGGGSGRRIKIQLLDYLSEAINEVKK